VTNGPAKQLPVDEGILFGESAKGRLPIMPEYDLSTTLADGTFIDWSSSSLWANGRVPDDFGAQVIFQPVDSKTYYVEIATGESFKIRSLDMEAHHLLLSGSLAVKNGLDVTSQSAEIDMFDGSLTAGSITLAGATFWRGISGVGQVTVSGELDNQSSITSEIEVNLSPGSILTVNAGTLVNGGALGASPGSTLIVDAVNFTNFHQGTLSGGTYSVTDGTLDLHTPGVITTNDASLVFDTGTGMFSYDPASGHYVSIESTLANITAGGSLRLDAAAYTASVALSDSGSIVIFGDGAQFAGPSLSVSSGGTVSLDGTSSNNVVISVSQLSNNGIITAVAAIGGAGPDIISAPAITGAGTIVIGPETSDIERGQTVFYFAAAELTGTVANAIKFSDGTGTVILDTPRGMTGSFLQFQAGDHIILSGVPFSSVTGYDYSGTTSSGVLTIHEGSTAIQLGFTGDYMTADFSLSSNARGLDILGVPPAGS
jgi:hypothetical protein